MASKYPIDETTVADAGAGGLIPPTIPPSLRVILQPGQAVTPTVLGQGSAQQASKYEGAQGVGLKTVKHSTLHFYKQSRVSCPHRAAVATREYTFTYISPSQSQSQSQSQFPPPPPPPPVPQKLLQLTQSAKGQQITGNACREPGDGLKTVQHVVQLPVVQEALASASNFYTKMKAS